MLKKRQQQAKQSNKKKAVLLLRSKIPVGSCGKKGYGVNFRTELVQHAASHVLSDLGSVQIARLPFGISVVASDDEVCSTTGTAQCTTGKQTGCSKKDLPKGGSGRSGSDCRQNPLPQPGGVGKGDSDRDQKDATGVSRNGSHTYIHTYIHNIT